MREGEKLWVSRSVLVLPTLFFLMLVAYPLYILARMSLSVPEPGRVTGTGVSLDNYLTLLGNPFFRETIVTTMRIGAFSALGALAVGLPLAIFIWKAGAKMRRTILFITICPILISIVVRSYGWMVLLSNRGLINSVLMQLGITSSPIKLIFNETGIVIGMVHVLLPFMVLSILSSLQAIEPQLEEAAATLGARPLGVVWDVVLPLAFPGIVAGLVLVFILSVGSFITPVLLGGQMVMTLPILALQQFTTTFNWALGSAIVVVLLVTVLAMIALLEFAQRRWLSHGVRQ